MAKNGLAKWAGQKWIGPSWIGQSLKKGFGRGVQGRGQWKGEVGLKRGGEEGEGGFKGVLGGEGLKGRGGGGGFEGTGFKRPTRGKTALVQNYR